MTDYLFDFNAARTILKDGARAFFTRVRTKLPDEVLYVYNAIGSDDDAKLIHFVTNSQQHYEKDAAKYLADKARVKSDREKGFHHHVFWYKWGFPEWAYQGGEPDVEAFYELVEAAEIEDDEANDFDTPGPEVNVDLRAQSYAAAVLALRDLDSEGFFGSGAERERVTVFFSVIDSPETFWLQNETARLLNPPAVYEQFYAEWRPAVTTEADLARERERPSSVHKAFSAIIAEHS
jgi:hypothetical protein